MQWVKISETTWQYGDAGNQTPEGANGHVKGIAAFVEERERGFYACLAGIGDEGFYSETDDLGPFDTLEEAQNEALALFDD